MDLKWMFGRYREHTQALYDNYESVVTIKLSIEENKLDIAAGIWYELSQKIQTDLWLASTKGGVFTTMERKIIRSTEFRESYYGPSGDEDAETD